jgi:hypothetical protein
MTFIESIKDVYEVPEGMPLAVFQNKYSRVKYLEDNPNYDATVIGSNPKRPVYQTWEERITEVVEGNFTLDPRFGPKTPENCASFFDDLYAPWDNLGTKEEFSARKEFRDTLRLSKQGVMPYSGRHLQHGDRVQYAKTGELFTNCSTAMFSWTLFYLLLKGSGVGRDYSSDICWVDWEYMPECRFVLDGPDQWGNGGHPDYEPWIESLRSARHKYDSEGEKVRWFDVEDSAEGWVKMIMILETAAFHKNNKEHLFVFNFTPVRSKGTPIKGQQDRPASGPVPLIEAMIKIMTIKGAGFKPWKQALFIDDYLAACVAVGGIRRAARMSTKYWKDRDALEFADIKREGFLKSANNSLLVDAEFWELVRNPTNRESWAVHARRVFAAATEAAYHDGTGEPGFINVDQLTWSDEGIDEITVDNYIDVHYDKNVLRVHKKTKEMIGYMLDKAKHKKYKVIVNPCAEIPIAVWGAYCTIGDICGTYARTLEEFKYACWLMARALMRVNLMQYMYSAEVKRTMRIGVGMIGIFEFAWNHFQINLHEILLSELPPDHPKVLAAIEAEIVQTMGEDGSTLDSYNVYERSLQYAKFIEECRETVEQSARQYAAEIGVNVPHTFITLKPSGTASKALNSTEAANPPSNNFYLRNNQYPFDDPQYLELRRRGYPWQDISHSYAGHHIVGFPTKQQISDIMGDKVVVSAELTPEDQYEWLRWLERHWFGGKGRNGQVSFTMKYYPDQVSFKEFQQLLIEHQSTVKCCSWMQIMDMSKFPYQPEQPITEKQYYDYLEGIDRVQIESYDESELQCPGGFCPIEKDQLVFADGSNVTDADLQGASN